MTQYCIFCGREKGAEAGDICDVSNNGLHRFYESFQQTGGDRNMKKEGHS